MMRVAVVGASGRMGSALSTGAAQRDDVAIVCNITRDAAPSEPFDVIIDFSSPDGFEAACQLAQQYNVPLVSGTTGLSVAQLSSLAALPMPTLWSANFSVGVQTLSHLVELGAKALDFDIEIFEAHHRQKVDAPSGTALLLAQSAASGRAVELDAVAAWTRHGHTGPRRDGEIGFQVARGGSVVGSHTVSFYGEGETLELGHRATDRTIFARGALRAPLYLVQQESGNFTMKDVLFGADSAETS